MDAAPIALVHVALIDFVSDTSPISSLGAG